MRGCVMIHNVCMMIRNDDGQENTSQDYVSRSVRCVECVYIS